MENYTTELSSQHLNSLTNLSIPNNTYWVSPDVRQYEGYHNQCHSCQKG